MKIQPRIQEKEAVYVIRITLQTVHLEGESIRIEPILN